MARTTRFTKGSRVRLLHDITTRGGRTFRKGLAMTVTYDHREVRLSVCVRAKWHFLTLRKKDSY